VTWIPIMRGSSTSSRATSSTPLRAILRLERVLFGLFNYLSIFFNREAVDFFAMALYYDLPVYRDTYRLVLKIFEVTKDFPKEYKFTLGQDMKRDALQLVSSIYRAFGVIKMASCNVVGGFANGNYRRSSEQKKSG
jgi:hypothetical protein